MSEQEDFEKWLDSALRMADDKSTIAEWAWQASAERKDRIIEKKAAELEAFREENSDLESEVTHYEKELKKANDDLEALRKFARVALSTKGMSPLFENMLFGVAQGLSIIDEQGQPTALLTGESE